MRFDRRYACLALLFCLAGIQTSCSDSRRVEARIVDRIHACRAPQNCVISLADATDFDWDTVFAFSYTVRADERRRVVGSPEVNYVEFHRQLVFVKNGKIVYQELEPTNVEHPIRDEVAFDLPDGRQFAKYRRSDAHFQVLRKDGPDGPYYILEPH